MTGWQDLVVSYATQRTTTGFTTQLWESSTDGTTWTTVQSVTGASIPVAFGTITLPTITGLNNATTGYLRLTVTGATAVAGNNRLDNIQFNASTYVPPAALSITLGASPSSFGENAGASASTVTVTLSQAVLVDTVFDITENDADNSEIFIPTIVTVLANQTTATFPVAALTDALADGSQNVIITVSKSGYNSGQTTVTVTDTTPVIALSVVAPATASFAENATNPASTVTVTLTPAQTTDTILDITTNDTDASEISVPTTVTVLANQTTATFPVTVLNDNIPDGNQVIAVTASKTGYVSGNLNLTVVDTAPTITLSAVPTTFAETGSSVLTVTLSPVQTSDTTVTVVASTGAADLTLAAGGVVIVPANTASATIALTGVTDGVFDSNKTVALTASATGAQNGNLNVTVTNVDASPVLISEYYEGLSNDKYLEIKNTTASSLALTGYVIANWSNANAESWKTANLGSTGSSSASLATLHLPANGTLLLTNPAAAAPAYAVSGVSYTNGANALLGSGATFYNGNDAVVLYYDADANGTLTPNEIVDVVPFTNAGNEGADKVFHRISNAQGFDFIPGTSVLTYPAVWELKTLANVAAATPSDAFYLQGAVLPVTLTPTVSTFAENAGAAVSTVTVSVPYNVTTNTTIAIANPDTTELTTSAASVIIASGTNSITFTVNAVPDGIVDTTQDVTLTASVAGFTNGTTTLHVTNVDAAGYSSWQTDKFSSDELNDPTVSGDNADPDGDGLKNALEYALALDPKAGNSAAFLPQSTVTGTTLALTYLRPTTPVSGVTFLVQKNSELQTLDGGWTTATPVTDYTESTTTAGQPVGYEKVTITFTTAVTTKSFGRVGVSF